MNKQLHRPLTTLDIRHTAHRQIREAPLPVIPRCIYPLWRLGNAARIYDRH
jgi:hypothetical protein